MKQVSHPPIPRATGCVTALDELPIFFDQLSVDAYVIQTSDQPRQNVQMKLMIHNAASAAREAQDIAVFRMDNIGDAILSAGVLKALRKGFPESIITIFCKNNLHQYYKRCPYINVCIAIEAIRPFFREDPKVKEYFRRFSDQFAGAFDLAVNPRPTPDWYSADLYVMATAAPRRIGYRQTFLVDGVDPNPAYTELVPPPPRSVHAVAASRNLLVHLGVEECPLRPEIWFGRRASAKAASLIPPGRWIALGIGAAEPYKIWPAANFAALASALSDHCSGFVLVGSQDDATAAATIAAQAQARIIDLTGKTSLEESAAALSRCMIFVGNDSGPKHIAAAVGVPVVEIAWLSPDVPGFDDDHNFSAFGVPSLSIAPRGRHDHQATRAGAAVASIPAEAVVAAVKQLAQS